MRLLPLHVSDEERIELERRVRSNTVQARVAQRARIVLLAADGVSNRKIGELVGMHFNQVGIWRQRVGRDRKPAIIGRVVSAIQPAIEGGASTVLPRLTRTRSLRGF